jgi:hypothetical protein
VSEYALIALVAAAFLGLGIAVRQWWAIWIACLPSLLFFVLALPTWSEEDSDGMAGSDWFLAGFAFIGLPLIAGVALGVWVGRRLFGRAERS